MRDALFIDIFLSFPSYLDYFSFHSSCPNAIGAPVLKMHHFFVECTVVESNAVLAHYCILNTHAHTTYAYYIRMQYTTYYILAVLANSLIHYIE